MRLPAAQRRAELLNSATTVFARDGYHAASVQEIAEGAGVTKPVMYQHFASKRGLYIELLHEIGSHLRDQVSKATAQAHNPREQIQFGFRAYFDFVAREPLSYQVLFGTSSRSDVEFAAAVQDVEASIAEVVADLIDVEGLSHERRVMLGNGIVGLAEGACRYWLTHQVEVDPTVLADECTQLAWAGLRAID